MFANTIKLVKHPTGPQFLSTTAIIDGPDNRRTVRKGDSDVTMSIAHQETKENPGATTTIRSAVTVSQKLQIGSTGVYVQPYARLILSTPSEGVNEEHMQTLVLALYNFLVYSENADSPVGCEQVPSDLSAIPRLMAGEP